MKKILCLLISCILVLSAVFLCSCEEESESEESKTSSKTSQVKLGESEKLLTDYMAKYIEGDNPLYGIWSVKNMDSYYFVFRNDKIAEMVMESEGYFTALGIDKKKSTITAQFYFGINGEYKYSLSKNKNTLTLTNISDSTNKVTLKRQKKTDFVPKAPTEPKIDDALLGWWSNDEGMTYFFGKDGIMYSNSIMLETCYTYSAENGKIKAVYNLNGKNKETFKYSVKGKTLTIDGAKFKKTKK